MGEMRSYLSARVLPSRWRGALDVVAALTMTAAGLVILWGALFAGRPKTPAVRGHIPLPAEPVSIEGASTLGDLNAPVAIVLYSDFQCPFCARFATDTMPELIRRYVEKGSVLLAFRHFPLTQIHAQAEMAAEAAECAGQQGRFWQMHDLLFQNQRRLTKTDLASHAEVVGLEGKRFGECLAGEMKAQVRRDAESAARLGIRGTPGFLIGALEPGLRVRVKRTLAGAGSPKTFMAELDLALGRGTASDWYGVAVLVGIVATGAVAVGVRRRRRSSSNGG